MKKVVVAIGLFILFFNGCSKTPEEIKEEQKKAEQEKFVSLQKEFVSEKETIFDRIDDFKKTYQFKYIDELCKKYTQIDDKKFQKICSDYKENKISLIVSGIRAEQKNRNYQNQLDICKEYMPLNNDEINKYCNINNITKNIAQQQDNELLKELGKKAYNIYKKHPNWSKDECKDVAKGRYWIGMSYEMLVISFGGKPDSANPSNYGNGTRWQWCWHSYTPSCFYDKNDDGLIDSYN